MILTVVPVVQVKAIQVQVLPNQEEVNIVCSKDEVVIPSRKHEFKSLLCMMKTFIGSKFMRLSYFLIDLRYSYNV